MGAVCLVSQLRHICFVNRHYEQVECERYWGKGTEASKVNFAKPAKDLDALLEQLGAQRLMPTGFGDDHGAGLFVGVHGYGVDPGVPAAMFAYDRVQKPLPKSFALRAVLAGSPDWSLRSSALRSLALLLRGAERDAALRQALTDVDERVTRLAQRLLGGR